MKQDLLKLNANLFPISVTNWRKAFVDIVSGAVFPVDVYYETDEEGNINKEKIESFNIVKSFDEWAALPIRTFDDYVNTSKTSYRIPPIVVCAEFNKIIFKKVVFPTKSNIWRRDNYTCLYTGEKLTKEQISVDHILPISRGGKNTWENLATCKKSLNVWKSDRTPRECGLKLLQKPSRPTNGIIFDFVRKEWEIFIDGGSCE